MLTIEHNSVLCFGVMHHICDLYAHGPSVEPNMRDSRFKKNAASQPVFISCPRATHV